MVAIGAADGSVGGGTKPLGIYLLKVLDPDRGGREFLDQILGPVERFVYWAWAAISGWGTAGLNNNGPHGFSEILYAYTSASANNGSAFGGLTCTPTDGDRTYNVTMSIAILVGRYFQLVPILANAGALARKRPAPASAGSFPVTGGTFCLLVAGVTLIVGALSFLPSLALGSIVEHFVMNGSHTTF